jgi:hypothetical protein
MSDRLAAQLRQHFLDSVDIRAAEGQHAAIVERVASAGQRHPLVARLLWTPGRIGPVPSAALRYGLVALALVATTLAVVILAGGPSRSTVFEGSWTSTDPLDGSRQTLVVARGSRPSVHFVDEYASVETCAFDTSKVFTADGSGSIDDSRLHVAWPDGGSCGLMIEPLGDDDGLNTFRYDEATESLLDGLDVNWTRTHDDVALPTRGTLASFPPVGPPTCAAMPDGTYSHLVGPLRVTATAPATWSGDFAGFQLENNVCLMAGDVRLVIDTVDEVYADICHWRGTGVELRDPTKTTAYSAQPGFGVAGPIETEIAGHPAVRFDFSVPASFDEQTCDRATLQLWGGPLGPGRGRPVGPGETATVYLLNVAGVPMGISAIRNDASADAAEVAELDAVVASLSIEP